MQWHLWAYIYSPKFASKVSIQRFFLPLVPLVNNVQISSPPSLHYFLQQPTWKVTVCWYQKAGPTDYSKSGCSSGVEVLGSAPPARGAKHHPRAPRAVQPQKATTEEWSSSQPPGIYRTRSLENRIRKKNRRIILKGWIINIQPPQTTVRRAVPMPLYLDALSQRNKPIWGTTFKFQDATSQSFQTKRSCHLSCQFSPFTPHSLISNPPSLHSYALQPRWVLRTVVHISPSSSSEIVPTCTLAL